MIDKKISDMLKKLNKEVTPGKFYSLKLRLKLRSKAYALGWRHATAGMNRWKAAGAFSLVMVLLTGGLGTYAYASPEVTVDHPLYPVKQGLESAEEFFAGDAGAHAKVQMRHAMRRMDEMEKLADRMEQSDQPDTDEEDVRLTMQMMQEHMKNSLDSAANEEKVDDAEDVIQAMHDNFSDVEKHLDMMNERQHLRVYPSMHANIDDMRDFTHNKLQRIEEVGREIKSPVRIQRARIIMRRLTDNDSDILNGTQDPPVLQFTFSR